ncbi:alpha/beta fold hydrolase [Rhizobium sp.]|uniref:alpha/beta fold hydrolase n=1 Tax=Rhizobium TaxID=379 RepID=UPI003981BF57
MDRAAISPVGRPSSNRRSKSSGLLSADGSGGCRARRGGAPFDRHARSAGCTPHLVSISCPTAILVGEADRITPPALSEEIADSIPASRLTVIPDCGHLSPIEQPEAVTQALLLWLNADQRTH